MDHPESVCDGHGPPSENSRVSKKKSLVRAAGEFEPVRSLMEPLKFFHWPFITPSRSPTRFVVFLFTKLGGRLLCKKKVSSICRGFLFLDVDIQSRPRLPVYLPRPGILRRACHPHSSSCSCRSPISGMEYPLSPATLSGCCNMPEDFSL